MLIKLTEIQKKRGFLVEIPILLNPDGIAAVLQDTDELVKGEIPIINEKHEHRTISLIKMRTGDKLAVRETLDEIRELANGDRAKSVAEIAQSLIQKYEKENAT